MTIHLNQVSWSRGNMQGRDVPNAGDTSQDNRPDFGPSDNPR